MHSNVVMAFTLRLELCSAALGSLWRAKQNPIRALADPRMPSSPDQVNRAAEMVAKRL